jgi:hypothetical protein
LAKEQSEVAIALPWRDRLTRVGIYLQPWECRQDPGQNHPDCAPRPAVPTLCHGPSLGPGEGTDRPSMVHGGGEQPGTTLCSPPGTSRKWTSIFSCPLATASRPHFITANRLPNSPLPLPHPSPCRLAMAHRHPRPCPHPPPGAHGTPHPRTQNRKPGDRDSYPPGLYVRLRQNQYFTSQYNGLLTPVHLEAIMGLITIRKANGPRWKRDHAAESVPRFFTHYLKRRKSNKVPAPPAPIPVALVPVGNRTLWAGPPQLM